MSERVECQKEIKKEFVLLKSEIDGLKNSRFNIMGSRLGQDYVVTPFDDEEEKSLIRKLEDLPKPLRFQQYGDFWMKYKKSHERESNKESLIEAFDKLS